MMKKANNNNPWTREDEWEHPHSVMEWWCLISFLKSIEDKKRWSSKISFCEWCKDKKEIGSIINFDLFDQDEEKHFIYYLRNDSTKLKTVKDSFYISYDDSYMKGKYPNYELYINDKKNNIKVNITFTAFQSAKFLEQLKLIKKLIILEVWGIMSMYGGTSGLTILYQVTLDLKKLYLFI
jgi:hypothetical protein